MIQSVITSGGRISGNFDAGSQQPLAILLRAGALPAPLTVVEERTVGPELGADFIRDGALALPAGFLLVVGFMGTFYGLFGWYANVALVVNLVPMLAILSLFEDTLTLPGMAGFAAHPRHGGGCQHPDATSGIRGREQKNGLLPSSAAMETRVPAAPTPPSWTAT